LTLEKKPFFSGSVAFLVQIVDAKGEKKRKFNKITYFLPDIGNILYLKKM